MEKVPKVEARIKPLDWGDPQAVRHWLEDLLTHTEDAIAAGLDATDRLSRRVLSRAEARRQILEAHQGITWLLTAMGWRQR